MFSLNHLKMTLVYGIKLIATWSIYIQNGIAQLKLEKLRCSKNHIFYQQYLTWYSFFVKVLFSVNQIKQNNTDVYSLHKNIFTEIGLLVVSFLEKQFLVTWWHDWLSQFVLHGTVQLLSLQSVPLTEIYRQFMDIDCIGLEIKSH